MDEPVNKNAAHGVKAMFSLNKLMIGSGQYMLLCSFVLFDSQLASGIPQYTVQNLGEFTPLAINGSSQIAVTSIFAPPTAGVWKANNITQIQPAMSMWSFGYAINNYGEVAGASLNDQYVEEGFSWSSANGIASPVALPEQSFFGAINDLGQIGGAFWMPTDTGVDRWCLER